MNETTALAAEHTVASAVAEAAVKALLNAGVSPIVAASAFLLSGAALLSLAGHEGAALDIAARLAFVEAGADE